MSTSPEAPASGPLRPPPRALVPDALAAIASGVLLAGAFAPLDWGWLAFVALIPLLWTWRRAGPARAALLGFLAGVAFFALHLWWAVYFGAIAIVPLVFLEAAFWAGAGLVVGALGRWRVRSPWIAACAWVLLEAARVRWPLGGLAWGQAGVALHGFPFGRALASWGGVALASFVVVLVNGLLLEVACAAQARRRGARPLVLAGVALVLTVGLVGAANVARFAPTPTGALRFALLQGNDQDRRLTNAEIDAGYLTDRHLALAHRLHGRYDLIVFPESSVETDPEADPVLKTEIQALARQHHATVVVNVIDEQTRGKRYNANRFYGPDGRLLGTYDKQHLVPFGEYVPWRSQLSFISALNQVPLDFDPGHGTKVFDVAGTPVGTAICFESAFLPLMRASVHAGAQAIVVTTNNRSYRRSPNSAQHVELSQMSAAAVGRPVLHASVSGITAVITADGRVTRTTDLFRNTVVSGRVTTVTGDTPYVRFGDWVVGAAGLGLLGALAIGLSRRRLGPPDRHQAPSDE